MKEVIVMQGVSGSGKSTLAKQIAAAAKGQGHRTRVVSADHFFETPQGYKFDVSKLGEAHAECLRNFLDAIESGIHVVVVDNTNTSTVEIAPYMALAAAFGYMSKVIRVRCDPETAASRGLHGVPRRTIDAMMRRIDSERYPPWWKIEIVNGVGCKS